MNAKISSRQSPEIAVKSKKKKNRKIRKHTQDTNLDITPLSHETNFNLTLVFLEEPYKKYANAIRCQPCC